MDGDWKLEQDIGNSSKSDFAQRLLTILHWLNFGLNVLRQNQLFAQ